MARRCHRMGRNIATRIEPCGTEQGKMENLGEDGVGNLRAMSLRLLMMMMTQQIISGNSRSHWVPVIYGVPQGSVLGPLLFILYTADIPSLFPIHSATGHLFA